MCSLSANKTGYCKHKSYLTHSRIVSRHIIFLVQSSLAYISVCIIHRPSSFITFCQHIICSSPHWLLSSFPPVFLTTYNILTTYSLYVHSKHFAKLSVKENVYEQTRHHSVAITCRTSHQRRNGRICILLQISGIKMPVYQRFKQNLNYTGLKRVFVWENIAESFSE